MTEDTENMVSEDVFVNYKGSDKDDCLHFLTHVHVDVKNVSDENKNQKVQLSDIISPTVKRIYTSRYNAWYLKKNFDVEHIDVQGFETNKSFEITFNGNRYIYSFIDSMFSTGSVALLLHGPFGTCLYTGYFSFYREFLQSPLLKQIIEERVLSTLYFDATYYERSFSFEGFDELIKSVVNLIRKKIDKKIYLYADKGEMEHLIAQIALQLKEKVYVSEDTMEIMRLLGHGEANFTCEPSETRIYVNKAFMRKRGRDNENIKIKINRITEEKFIPGKKKKNPYDFDFYCSSNNKEICKLIEALRPETTVELYRVIDRSKITFNDKFKNGIPQEQLNIVEKAHFLKMTTEPPVRSINCTDSIKSILSNFPAHDQQDFNNGHRLRVRKVPEINTFVLSTISAPVDSNNHSQDDVLNDDLTSMGSNIPSNESNNNKEAKSSSGNILLLPSPHNLHNYSKPKPQNIIKTNSQSLGESCSILKTISINEKQSTSGIKPKPHLPLVMTRKLIKDKTILLTNSNLVKIPKGAVYSQDKNKTVILPSNLIERLNDKCTSISFDNVNKCIPKKTVSILKKGKILTSSLSNMKGVCSPLQSQSNTKVEVVVNNSLNKTTAGSAVNSNNVTPKERSCSKTNEITQTTSLVNSLNESCLENGTMEENNNNSSIKVTPCPNVKEEELINRKKKLELGVNNLLNETVASKSNIVTPKESSCSKDKAIAQTTSVVNNLNECSGENGTMEKNNKNTLNTAQCLIDKEVELINRKKKLELGVNNLLNETVASSAVKSNIVTPKESSCSKAKAIAQTTSFVNSLKECCSENRTMEAINNSSIIVAPFPTVKEEELIHRNKNLKITGNDVDSLINPSTTAQCPSDKENGSFGRKEKLEVSRIDVDSHNNTEVKNKGKGSKRKLSLINEETTISRKKLRSNSLMSNLLQPKPIIKEEPKPVIKEEQQTIPCSVSLDRNEMKRTYFYSSYCGHFLPKFYGFKRYELRPRKQLLKLRYLEKLIKN